MRSFWSDPYLWIHLAGLAAVPLWLEVCLLGLATGDPILPYWLEILLVAGIGIAPILWMQWQRPFDIYSLLVVALRPEQLTVEQRQVLSLFTAPRNRLFAVGVAIAMAILLQKLYGVAPIAASMSPFQSSGRLVGLLVAAIAFLAANLFTQVPVAVASVLFTSETAFSATTPLTVEEIRQRFLLLGLPVQRILPEFVRSASVPPATSVNQPNLETMASGAETVPSEPLVSSSPAPVETPSDDDVWGEESDLLSESLGESPAAEPTPTLVEVEQQSSVTEDDLPEQAEAASVEESDSEEEPNAAIATSAVPEEPVSAEPSSEEPSSEAIADGPIAEVQPDAAVETAALEEAKTEEDNFSQ